jgi:hypothetical protein
MIGAKISIIYYPVLKRCLQKEKSSKKNSISVSIMNDLLNSLLDQLIQQLLKRPIESFCRERDGAGKNC